MSMNEASAMTGASRILIVDDDEDVRDLLVDALGMVGFQITTANDGYEALDQLGGAPDDFDVVLLDKGMPGIDGFEVLRLIKENEALSRLPVIMVTGASDTEDITEGMRLGAFHYLIKPFDLGLLRTIIRSAMDDARLYHSLEQDIQEKRTALQHMTRASFTFKTLREARSVTSLLAGACPNPDEAVVGLVELMINAVEHGNLGITFDEKTKFLDNSALDEEITRRLALPDYAGRTVEVVFEKEANRLVFTITDQGDGFDWASYMRFDPRRLTHTHGRGIALANNLSFSSLKYQGKGNIVVASINLPE